MQTLCQVKLFKGTILLSTEGRMTTSFMISSKQYRM